MKNIIKILIKKLIGGRGYNKIEKFKSYFFNLIDLIINTYKDGRLYYKHSMVFKQNTFNKIESKIIMNYHGLEKGFLHDIIKPRFGELRVIELINLLKQPEVVNIHTKSQIAAAYLSICRYYEIHKNYGIDISDYFTSNDYEYFKSLSTLDTDSTKTHNRAGFFKESESNFSEFAKSRGSIRSFTGEKIPLERINKIIELTKTAPSVCNRQSCKIYYLDNKNSITRILEIQRGLYSYSEEITQLLVLVSDRNYFYSIGERNQLYIEGGIFLMNLLYALHFFKVGACPAHWGFNYKQDKRIQKELGLTDSEKVICLIPIGVPTEYFKTTLSLRRNNSEILKVISND